MERYNLLLSMTGQGQGRTHCGMVEIASEVRAVNNRHLKLQLRVSEGLGRLESQIEAQVRGAVRRGSLQLIVQLTGGSLDSGYQIQNTIITSYLKQSRQLAQELGIGCELELRDLLQLPGAISERRSLSANDGELPAELVQGVLQSVADALECLNRMRRVEGESMAQELRKQLQLMEALLDEIEQRAPQTLEEYRARLETKLNAALERVGAKAAEADLLREVLLIADKADIREEIVRLRSHISQFRGLLEASESQGRKLDFLTQELFRESNTIGSKAGDATIAQKVVEFKSLVEQIRELVQNVE